MSNPDLAEIERNIAAARARLAQDLTRLQSAAAVNELKGIVTREVGNSKDKLMQTALSGIESAVQTTLHQLKAKALANPAAVLAIGAGLAWKLFRSPPVASIMVGLGLYSLLRTRADDSLDVADAPRRFGRQLSDFAGEVSGRIAGTATALGDRAAALADRTTDAARGLAGDAAHYAGDLSARVLPSPDAAAAPQADAEPFVAAPPLADLEPPSRDARDTLLLGAAGVAVAVALGIAYQRGHDN